MIHKIHKEDSKNIKINHSVKGKAKEVLKEAHLFLGTPYKYGGASGSGMDCSGLLLTAYNKVGVKLPRISREQAKVGMEINLKSVLPGDALFFNTSGRRISHVGIVDYVKKGEIFFIHASSSRGVMISSLNERYWKKRFVKAVRYLH